MTTTAITVGLDTYTNTAWHVAEARLSREIVEKLLVKHGAQPQDWTPRATNGEIRKVLREWSDMFSNSLVIYWVGHGAHSDDGYRVALADSSALTDQEALTSTDFWQVLRNQWRRRKANGCEDRWVLLILDTCGSGEGAWELWRQFDQRPDNVGVIAAADEGAANVGRLATTLEHLLKDGYGGNDTAGIPLFDLMQRLEARIGTRRVHHSFESSAILPLPSGSPPPMQATVDVYREMRELIDAAPEEVRNHFYAKAQGAEIGELTWHFTGRESERREVSAWLREASGGMFVVSGVAGSGKSALVGMLFATSDDQVTDALAKIGYGPIRDELRPTGVPFDAVIHLSGRTFPETIAALSASLHTGTGDNLDTLLRAIESREDGRLTVLVDALDEARDPLIIAAALRQLAAIPGVRVLVGTRQSTHEDPDQPVPPDKAILETLAAARGITLERERDAVIRYVESRLRAALPRLRAAVPDLGDTRITDLARMIAWYEQPFLFARLAVGEIIAEPKLADDDESLAHVLDFGHSGIFGHAVHRLSQTEPEVEALLHVLTYARGNGFPRTGGIWALAASELAEAPLDDLHVETALKVAAPFIMQDSEFGQSVYRLAHRTFADWYIRNDTQ
jgi:hypothetical protein